MGFYRRKCYGYDKDENGDLVINEEQAEVIKLIFDLYLGDKSILGIVKELKERSIKSPTGKDNWPKRSIEEMLSNLRLAILIQSSDSIYVKNTDKSSVSAVFSGSGIQIECV